MLQGLLHAGIIKRVGLTLETALILLEKAVDQLVVGLNNVTRVIHITVCWLLRSRTIEAVAILRCKA